MRTLLVVSATFVLIACGSTPGDAARRAGQSEAAAKLYRQGADQGDGRAALKLGLLLADRQLDGFGQPGEWFVRGCTVGEVVACHNAGFGYEYGQHGLNKTYADAARHYRAAAERGYMPSQYNLGSLYSNSYLHDDVEGLKWLLVSQTQAHACASNPGCKWILDDEPNHVGRLRARMSAAEVLNAEQQASAWVLLK